MCPSSLQVDTTPRVHIASMTSNYNCVQTATGGRLLSLRLITVSNREHNRLQISSWLRPMSRQDRGRCSVAQTTGITVAAEFENFVQSDPRKRRWSFVFCEKLLGCFCDKDLRKFCWWFCPGWQNSGSSAAPRGRCFAHANERGSGRALWAVYGRSDRNTSNSGRFGQSVQFMRMAQGRINTGYFASC
jgi:hypothetical protein